MTRSKLRGRLDPSLALVVLLTVFAFAPLAYPGFFQSHSGFLPVFHLYDLEADLWGNWGWAPHLVSSPNPLTGEGALPYLLAELLRWFGLDGVQAIRGVYALGFVISGVTAYLLARRLFGRAAGVSAAVVYVYVPFHLATVYVRGAFAEAWAFAMFPAVILCFDKYLGERNMWSAVLAALSYVALGCTNLGLALLFALLVLFYVLAIGTSRQAKRNTLVLLALAVSLALVFQLPTVIRYGLPVIQDSGFSQHFVYPFQLLSASWGYGASIPGWKDTMPLRVGLAATGLTLVTLLLLPGRRGASPRVVRTAAFFVAAAGVIVFLVTHPASLFWQVTRLSYAVSYPWQVLSLAGFAMSMASAAMVRLEPRLARLPWQAFLVSLVIVGSYDYLSPRFTDVRVGGSPVAVLGDEAMLLSSQRDGPLRHGATVHLTLYWQSLRLMDTDYTVFVHVVDQEGTIWAQDDSIPVDGERPTSGWELGEIIEDTHVMTIDVDGPPEGYLVEVGLYDPNTGTRLPLSSGATAILLQ
jgi:hypothetical protein